MIQVGPAHKSLHPQLVKIAKTSPYTTHFSNTMMFSSDAAYEKGWICAAYDEDNPSTPLGFYCVRQKVRGDKETMLYFITVLPEYRSSKVGAHLMHHMKDTSPRSLIRLNVAKANTEAVKFYVRHDFVIVSTEALKGEGYTMEWSE